MPKQACPPLAGLINLVASQMCMLLSSMFATLHHEQSHAQFMSPTAMVRTELKIVSLSSRFPSTYGAVSGAAANAKTGKFSPCRPHRADYTLMYRYDYTLMYRYVQSGCGVLYH